MDEVKKKKKAQGRPKGHGFERTLMNLFIRLGWTRCKTSRSESRNRDDLKVDLCFSEPFNVQAKAVENLGSPHKFLAEMPKEEGMINLVWHKKNHQGSIVAMTEKDFLTLLDMLIKSGSIIPS